MDAATARNEETSSPALLVAVCFIATTNIKSLIEGNKRQVSTLTRHTSQQNAGNRRYKSSAFFLKIHSVPGIDSSA
jgi:hypothetical protein